MPIATGHDLVAQFVERGANETSPRHPLRRAILIVAEKPLDFTLDTTSCMRQESY